MKSLVAHLPPDSALCGELGLDWTLAHELAAVNVEVGFEQYRATLAAAGVKAGRLPKPLHIPRPKAPSTPDKPTPPPRRKATVAETLAALKAGHKGV